MSDQTTQRSGSEPSAGRPKSRSKTNDPLDRRRARFGLRQRAEGVVQLAAQGLVLVPRRDDSLRLAPLQVDSQVCGHVARQGERTRPRPIHVGEGHLCPYSNTADAAVGGEPEPHGRDSPAERPCGPHELLPGIDARIVGVAYEPAPGLEEPLAGVRDVVRAHSMGREHEHPALVGQSLDHPAQAGVDRAVDRGQRILQVRRRALVPLGMVRIRQVPEQVAGLMRLGERPEEELPVGLLDQREQPAGLFLDRAQDPVAVVSAFRGRARRVHAVQFFALADGPFEKLRDLGWGDGALPEFRVVRVDRAPALHLSPPERRQQGCGVDADDRRADARIACVLPKRRLLDACRRDVEDAVRPRLELAVEDAPVREGVLAGDRRGPTRVVEARRDGRQVGPPSGFDESRERRKPSLRYPAAHQRRFGGVEAEDRNR